MKNPIVWVEIPVSDKQRAVNFYNQAFSWDIQFQTMGPLHMAMLPFSEDTSGISGALVYHETAYGIAELGKGCLVYLAVDKIDESLKAIRNAGGEVLVEKQKISPEHGSMAVFRDSEGNRVALYSQE